MKLVYGERCDICQLRTKESVLDHNMVQCKNCNPALFQETKSYIATKAHEDSMKQEWLPPEV